MRIWLSTKTQDEEFNDLRAAGHTGSLNDMQFSYLGNRGLVGALADRMAAYLGGDTTAPVLSGNSFNDTTDEATFSTTEGGTIVMATHLTTESVSANGSGGWTGSTLETGTDTVATAGETTVSFAYTATTGTGGESRKFSYYIRDAAGNDSNVITETFTVNSSYTENYVDNNGTAYLTAAWTQFTANSQVEWAFRIKPQQVASTVQLYQSDGRIEIQQYDSRLNVIIKDTTNTVVYQHLTNTGEFSVGVEAFVYIGANSATGSYDVRINNVAVSGTPTTSTTGTAIEIGSNTGLLAYYSGAIPADVQISEAFMGSGSNAGAAALWNGGTKANLATLAGYTPDIYFGNGQAATAWDAATNLGTATFSAGATGFTEA